jgi:hypothetical protein
MLVRRKTFRKRPRPNRWPDFVRFVAWPFGERLEAELWGWFLLHAHQFALLASFVVLFYNLTTNTIDSLSTAVSVVMVLPFVSFSISDYYYS